MDTTAVEPTTEEPSMCIGPDVEDDLPLPSKGQCVICGVEVEGAHYRVCATRVLEGETYKTNIFCLECYTKGKFETRCSVCGIYIQCAPTHIGDPKFTCIGCQWSRNAKLFEAEQANAKARRTVT
jgi:hypothetical protein